MFSEHGLTDTYNQTLTDRACGSITVSVLHLLNLGTTVVVPHIDVFQFLVTSFLNLFAMPQTTLQEIRAGFTDIFLFGVKNI